MVDKDETTEEMPAAPAVPAPRRGPGHRGADMRDTVAEMAERAQLISQEAGSKVSSAMKDVISAAAGLAGFAIESARDLVQYMVRRKDGAAAWQTIAGELVAAPILFHPADRRLADLAADFKARFKMSLADAFAAALAKERKAELVTGDSEFKPLEKEIKINWLK